MTDGYYSVSSMQRTDENLYQQSDTEGWPASSQSRTSGQQTHAVTFRAGTKDEELQTALTDHFTAV